MSKILTQTKINSFLRKLQSEHKTASIIAEYNRNIVSLQEIAKENDDILNKSVLEEWKNAQKKRIR